MTAKSKKQPGPAHAPSTPHTTRPLAGISFLKEDEILANLDFTQLIPPPKHGGKHVMLTNKQNSHKAWSYNEAISTRLFWPPWHWSPATYALAVKKRRRPSLYLYYTPSTAKWERQRSRHSIVTNGTREESAPGPTRPTHQFQPKNEES